MKKFSMTLITLAMLAFLTGITSYYGLAQTTWTVDDDGPADFATIQAAINAAAPSGDVIQVAGGTYIETIVVVGKSLTLQGSGAASTIIKAPPTVHHATINIVVISGSGVNVELTGFTVTGPGSPEQYNTIQNGILIESGANADIHDNAVKDIRDDVNGGPSGYQTGRAIRFSHATGTVVNNIVTGYQKGGIYLYYDDSSAVISGNTVTGWGPTANAQNGICLVYPATATIENNIVSDNQCTNPTAEACGILLFWAGTTSVRGNTLSSNDRGVSVSYLAPGQYNVNYNDIVGNTIGVANDVHSVVVDALYNWWGDASGPYDPLDTDGLNQHNPGGLGDYVTEYVLYTPWVGIGGFVTGGGTIWSELGDYEWNPDAEGVANFGFVAQYKKGANVPVGNTNFVFSAGDLHFQSSEYDWLVVAGNTAKFKGVGTIDGASGIYKFMIWASDDDTDTFRIKIWEEDVEDVVYDNGGDPLTGGNIFIHKEKKK